MSLKMKQTSNVQIDWSNFEGDSLLAPPPDCLREGVKFFCTISYIWQTNQTPINIKYQLNNFDHKQSNHKNLPIESEEPNPTGWCAEYNGGGGSCSCYESALYVKVHSLLFNRALAT